MTLRRASLIYRDDSPPSRFSRRCTSRSQVLSVSEAFLVSSHSLATAAKVSAWADFSAWRLPLGSTFAAVNRRVIALGPCMLELHIRINSERDQLKKSPFLPQSLYGLFCALAALIRSSVKLMKLRPYLG